MLQGALGGDLRELAVELAAAALLGELLIELGALGGRELTVSSGFLTVAEMACGELLALLAFADGDLVFTPLALLAALALVSRGLVMDFVATVAAVMMVAVVAFAASVAVAVPVLVTVVVGEGDAEWSHVYNSRVILNPSLPSS